MNLKRVDSRFDAASRTVRRLAAGTDAEKSDYRAGIRHGLSKLSARERLEFFAEIDFIKKAPTNWEDA